MVWVGSRKDIRGRRTLTGRVCTVNPSEVVVVEGPRSTATFNSKVWSLSGLDGINEVTVASEGSWSTGFNCGELVSLVLHPTWEDAPWMSRVGPSVEVVVRSCMSLREVLSRIGVLGMFGELLSGWEDRGTKGL